MDQSRKKWVYLAMAGLAVGALVAWRMTKPNSKKVEESEEQPRYSFELKRLAKSPRSKSEAGEKKELRIKIEHAFEQAIDSFKTQKGNYEVKEGLLSQDDFFELYNLIERMAMVEL